MVSYLNKKSLHVFEFQDSSVLYIFYRYEHYMSISHMAIFVYMAMQHTFHLLTTFEEFQTGLKMQSTGLKAFV